MKSPLIILALTGAALAQTSNETSTSLAADHITSVCLPDLPSGHPDFNTPCNAIKAIEAQCIYGPAFLDSMLAQWSRKPKRQSNDYYTLPTPQDNATQRICVCESQFWDQVQGCEACYTAHGSEDLAQFRNGEFVSSVRSSYCAASATPTEGFAMVLYSFVPSGAAASLTSQVKDPIGNRTEVSLYYTASVTGSAAWVVAEETGSGGVGTFTAVNTQNGQIVPTASAGSGVGGEGGSSVSTGGAAVRTNAVVGAGVVGLAGLVALL